MAWLFFRPPFEVFGIPVFYTTAGLAGFDFNPRLVAFYGGAAGLASASMNQWPSRLFLAMPKSTAPNRLNATDFSSRVKFNHYGWYNIKNRRISTGGANLHRP